MQPGMMQPGMMNPVMGMMQSNTAGIIEKAIPEDNNFSNNKINVIFRLSGFKEGISDTPIIYQVQLKDKISTFINKYVTDSKNEDENNKFIYKTKSLNPESTFEEAGVKNNANIFVITLKKKNSEQN